MKMINMEMIKPLTKCFIVNAEIMAEKGINENHQPRKIEREIHKFAKRLNQNKRRL